MKKSVGPKQLKIFKYCTESRKKRTPYTQ